MLKYLYRAIIRYIKLFDRVIYTFIEDCGSWRNKLIIVTAVFCYMAIKTADPGVVAATLVVWGSIIAYFFKKKQEADLNHISKPSKFDKEVKVDEAEDTDETFEESD